jgi:hypothetical protein
MGGRADVPRGASGGFTPPGATPAELARRQKTLRRVERQRRAPTWAKKIPWILFPIYGLMRLRDPNYEEHYQQWQDEQRNNYDGRVGE